MILNKLKTLAAIFLFSVGSFGQKNYIIEYDKITDGVRYFESEWTKGEKKTKEVDDISVSHNDIVTVKVINVNQLAFDTEVIQVFTGEKEFANPFSQIIKAFGSGLPGLNILSSIGEEAPSNIGGRNESEIMKKHKEKIYAILGELHSDMRDATEAYVAFEAAESVIYSKSKTKAQIKQALELALENVENTDVGGLILKIQSNSDQLEELLDEDLLDYDNKTWDDIDLMDNAMSQFDALYFDDDYEEYKSISPSQSFRKLASTKFTIEHTYRAKTHQGSWENYDSNDFYLLFREKKEGVEESDDLLVDHAKMISLKTKNKYRPHWAAGIDYVMPFSGRSEYIVTSTPASDWDLPDTLNVSENGVSPLQLTVGTKLCFDIPTKNVLIPSGVFGISIGGLSNSEEDFNFNFLLGGGLGFKSFPYLSLNAGISLSQLNVLKDEYRLNTGFTAPEGYLSSDQSDLFDKKFKLGVYFGISFRL